MKAGIFFTGTGPVLILTTFESFADSRLVEKLTAKGINKFIAYGVSEDDVKKKYGAKFDIVMGDLNQTDDLRVLDIDGHHVFNNFSLKALSGPIYYEEG